jgi:hypothetical protein
MLHARGVDIWGGSFVDATLPPKSVCLPSTTIGSMPGFGAS